MELAGLTLDELKRAVGIDTAETTYDALLTQLESNATAWVERQTLRRFRIPLATVVMVEGSGTKWLSVPGDIADADDVEVRALDNGAWSEVDADDYEVRGNRLLSLAEAWGLYRTFEVTFPDGWTAAPADVRALVCELVAAMMSQASGDAGVISEKLGDYSYTLDAASASADLSATAQGTVQAWRRLPV